MISKQKTYIWPSSILQEWSYIFFGRPTNWARGDSRIGLPREDVKELVMKLEETLLENERLKKQAERTRAILEAAMPAKVAADLVSVK